MNSLAEENYLKALYTLANAQGEVNVTELSKKLDIKMPTVTSMMKKLASKNLVHYEKYKPLRLTESGSLNAKKIIRKHRLTEMFLAEIMRIGWEEVHEIAEQIEHIQSPRFFEKMDELLGYPAFDPHGSPIPDKNGNVTIPNYRRLSECNEGQNLKLEAVTHTSADFLKYLNSRQLTLGVLLTIQQKEPFDNSMRIQYLNKEEVLSHNVCERLLVSIID